MKKLPEDPTMMEEVFLMSFEAQCRKRQARGVMEAEIFKALQAAPSGSVFKGPQWSPVGIKNTLDRLCARGLLKRDGEVLEITDDGRAKAAAWATRTLPMEEQRVRYTRPNLVFERPDGRVDFEDLEVTVNEVPIATPLFVMDGLNRLSVVRADGQPFWVGDMVSVKFGKFGWFTKVVERVR